MSFSDTVPFEELGEFLTELALVCFSPLLSSEYTSRSIILLALRFEWIFPIRLESPINLSLCVTISSAVKFNS